MYDALDEALFGKDGEPVERYLPVRQIRACEPIVLSDDRSSVRVVAAAPESVVVNGENYWAAADWRERSRPRSVDERCFLAFLQLANASPEEILSFAQKWGLLGLCKHGEPAAGHGGRPRDTQGPRISGRLRCAEIPTEPIKHWYRFAREFNLSLSMARRLRETTPASVDEWMQLGVVLEAGGKCRGVDEQRELLAGVVNRYLGASMVQPMATWEKRPTLTFGCRGRTTLFAALAFQLAMAITDSRMAHCSYCHRAYKPRRRPHVNEANACPSCRDGQANSERVQRFREKRRLQRRVGKERES